MKKITYLLLMLVTLLITSTPANVFALSCAEPPEPLQAFNEADTVLIGTVKNIEDGSILQSERKKTITLEVKEVFQGTETKELKIKEDFTWGQSEVGKTYLYYLKKENGSLVNPLCSATTSSLEEANAFTAYEPELDLEPILANTEDVEKLDSDYIAGFIVGAVVVLGIFIILIRSIRKIRADKKGK